MKKNVYRNLFFVKESLQEFIYSNRKYIIFSILAIAIGTAFGLCVGINNSSTYTFINFSNKSVLSALCGKKIFFCFFKLAVQYAFIVLLILILNNFGFLSVITYFLFVYISFKVTINCTIIICNCSLVGFVFSILYFVLSLAILAMLVSIFLLCKKTNTCSQSKLAKYPYKSICIIAIILFATCLLLCILSKIFSKIISLNI